MCVIMSNHMGRNYKMSELGMFGVDCELIDIVAGLMAFSNDFQTQSNSTVSSRCCLICNNIFSSTTAPSNNPDISELFHVTNFCFTIRDSSKCRI